MAHGVDPSHRLGGHVGIAEVGEAILGVGVQVVGTALVGVGQQGVDHPHLDAGTGGQELVDHGRADEAGARR